jgi:hypothetical protein
MRLTTPSRALLAAALVLGAARAASAQQAADAPIRPAAAAVAAAPGDLRAVAVYRFVPSRVAGMPSEIVLADSAGQLVAHFRLPGARAERPMLVALIGDQLILQGQTPAGVLTLRLRDPEHVARTREVVGRWHLEGGREGELRARVGR